MTENEPTIWYWTNKDVPGHEHGLVFHHWTAGFSSDVLGRVLIVQLNYPGAPEYFVLARKLASSGPYNDFDKAKKYAGGAIDCSIAYERCTLQEQVTNLKALWAEFAEHENDED
jgi:hypothetical protein